jgi:glycosyltransferase involved in cell wall biosynthesis
MNAAENQRDLQPLVSIVVNNFNYSRFLPAAIDSALAQSYAPVEVVVVDDGSTDNSREVISGYGDRVSAIFKPNGGQASAFNAGFCASHGSIVMFLDADDVLLPNAVEEVVRAWHPGVAKAQFVLAHIDAQGRALGGVAPYSPAQMPEGDIRNSILDAGGYIGVPTSGNAFARAVLDRLLPLPESQWHQAADAPLLILAPFLGEVVSLRKTLGCYRIHESNLGMLDEELDSRKLRVKIIIDLQREWALSEFASRSRFTIPLNWAAREPAHLKYRLASLRVDPTHHPIMDDRPIRLMLMGIRVSWRNSKYNFRSRLFHTLWFPLVALLPQAAAAKIIRLGLLPRRRRAKTLAKDLVPSTHTSDGPPSAPVTRPNGGHRKASA